MTAAPSCIDPRSLRLIECQTEKKGARLPTRSVFLPRTSGVAPLEGFSLIDNERSRWSTFLYRTKVRPTNSRGQTTSDFAIPVAPGQFDKSGHSRPIWPNGTTHAFPTRI